MRPLYSFGIHLLKYALKGIALCNDKIKLGVEGRQQTFSILGQKLHPGTSRMWFHCASLGEYEQGLPVYKELMSAYPDYEVIVSFFSPSGYENRKDSAVGDAVVYLPLDTPANAKQFLDVVQPKLAVFTNYDIWPNYVLQLQQRGIKAYLISALFRKDQGYFKWYGSLQRKSLKNFTHIFTQNESSKQLLQQLQINNVSVSGDTRCDRVTAQLKVDNHVAFLKHFKQDQLLIISGSSWPADDALLLPFINSCYDKSVKFVIAPHEISEKYTKDLKSQLVAKTIAFSDLNDSSDEDLKQSQVFILDTIGILSKAYSYADIAYVGGASSSNKKGLHNILEPSVFGIPVLIGYNYSNFPEAVDLCQLGGVSAVLTTEALSSEMHKLISSEDLRLQRGQINGAYVKERSGAVKRISCHILEDLKRSL